MSTKIYDGLIAVDTDLFTIANRIRATLAPIFLQQFKTIYDAYHELPNGSNWSYLPQFFDKDETVNKPRLNFDLYRKIQKLHRSSTWTFSDADIFYDVILLPNNAGGNPLVLLFGEKKSTYLEALLKAGVVEEYGYWNNSDEPEDVTEEEWDLRKKAWSSVEDSSPSEVGLSITAPSSIEASLFLSGDSKYSS